MEKTGINMPEKNKQKLKEHQKNYRDSKKSKKKP